MINILLSYVISNLYSLKYKSIKSINGGITLSPDVGNFQHCLINTKAFLKLLELWQ